MYILYVHTICTYVQIQAISIPIKIHDVNKILGPEPGDKL